IVAGLERKIDSREPVAGGIERSSRVGNPGRRHPTGGAQGEVVGMRIAHARVAGDSQVSAKLERVPALRPGEIIRQVVDRELEILAVGDSLIETDEGVPGLVGVTQNAVTGASKAVMEVVDR